MMKIIAALMLVLAVGCGGVEDDTDGYLTGSTCLQIGIKKAPGSVSIGWECSEKDYSAKCELSQGPGEYMLVTCQCLTIDKKTMSVKTHGGQVTSPGEWDDSHIPTDPLDLAVFVSGITGCEWWMPPFLSP